MPCNTSIAGRPARITCALRSSDTPTRANDRLDLGPTGSDVLIADKLFATLDTTVRALYPDTKPRLLVSDTVGFIKKLPHDFVASSRSTLDEALERPYSCM